MRRLAALLCAIFFCVMCQASENAPRRLTPQNAGDLFFSNDEFSIHEHSSYLPLYSYQSGPPRCTLERKPRGSEKTTSHLVAIVDKDVSFNLTRRWLWDNIRPVVQESVLPKICPDADRAAISVYIKGFDVTGSGEMYRTDDVVLPVIEAPSYTDDDVDEVFNMIEPHRVYHENVTQLVSRGILLIYFRGPKTKDRSCHVERDVNCSYETFGPVYLGNTELWGKVNALQMELGWGGYAEQEIKSRLNEINNMRAIGDKQSNFRDFAKNTRAAFLRNDRIQRENKERLARMGRFYKALDDEFKRDDFWARAFLSFAGDGGALERLQCNTAKSEGSLIPWWCPEEFPDEYWPGY